MGGNFNFREMERLAKDLEKLAQNKDELFQSAAKELAARLLTLLVERTLPGKYPAGSGIVGGTLRRGWASKTHKEAFSKRKNKPGAKTIQNFLKTIQVSSDGNTYTIEVINPVEYAGYVESGHRTVNHRNWVEGKFIMRGAVEDLQKIAPQVLEDKIERFLRECMND
jgi:hypothetical protein